MTLRRFSHSLIDSYLRCPRQAYYRYVEAIPSPKTGPLVRGSACDAGWNADLLAKMETGEDLSIEDVLEIIEQAFRDDVREQGGVNSVDWGTNNARGMLDSALKLGKVWMQVLAPEIQPLAVQVEYHRTLPSGRDFVGFVDFEGVVEGRAAIADNKTGARKMPSGDADTALQPYAYAWLKGPVAFAFTRAIDTGKNVNAEVVWTGRGAADILAYDEILTTVDQAWEAELFPPNPASMFCGKTRCPYWDRCPVGVGRTSFALETSNRETPEGVTA